MPKAATAAGTGAPVAGDHSNAMDIASPVNEEPIVGGADDPSQLGSHRAETDIEATDDTDADDTAEANVPARLKGKDLPGIYAEFAGLEREYSRLGNEVGENRNLIRELLQLSLQNKGAGQKKEDEPDPTDEDFESDPKSAAHKVIDKKLKPLEQRVISAEQRAMILEFNTKHPGFMETAGSADFQDWVNGSAYRTRMFEAAAKYDMTAAEDLFSMWEERKAAVGEQPTEAEKKKEAIKRNTTESGGAGKSAGGKSGKKIYKSSELARLKLTDPDRYNEMNDEIIAAFAEGRVR